MSVHLLVGRSVGWSVSMSAIISNFTSQAPIGALISSDLFLKLLPCCFFSYKMVKKITFSSQFTGNKTKKIKDSIQFSFSLLPTTTWIIMNISVKIKCIDTLAWCVSYSRFFRKILIYGFSLLLLYINHLFSLEKCIMLIFFRMRTHYVLIITSCMCPTSKVTIQQW